MARHSNSYLGSATDAVDITPHASTVFAATRAVACLVSGTAAVRFADSAADVSVQLNAGVTYPYSIVSCRVTGTTATGIVGFY